MKQFLKSELKALWQIARVLVPVCAFMWLAWNL